MEVGSGGGELDEVVDLVGVEEGASHLTSARNILTISLMGSERKLSTAGSILGAVDRTF